METRLLGKRRILRRNSVRLNSDGVVRVFMKTVSRFCPKNTQGIRTDKRSMMFWGAIRSDGRKMLIECPATLNSYGYLEILKQYDRHLNIPDLVFQQDNAPVHKSENVRNFLAQKKKGSAGLVSLQF